MRSWLFVPADSEKKLDKALGCGADCLIVDLEDSVALDAKARARHMAAEFIRNRKRETGSKIFVRINPFSSGLSGSDLEAVMPAEPSGIMLPKADGIASFDRLAQLLDQHEEGLGLTKDSTHVLPIITETAGGLLASATWNQTSERMAGVTWGAEDLSADLGVTRPRDEQGRYTDVFRHARMMTLVAAGACQTAAIDTVFVDFRDDTGLARECIEAERDGFSGKLAIHPGQVEIINRAFSVSPAAVEEARAIIEAFREAGNPGVVGIGGKMYDKPHLRRAERVLAKIEAQKPKTDEAVPATGTSEGLI